MRSVAHPPVSTPERLGGDDLWLQEDLDRAVLLLLEDLVAVRGFLQRQVVGDAGPAPGGGRACVARAAPDYALACMPLRAGLPCSAVR